MTPQSQDSTLKLHASIPKSRGEIELFEGFYLPQEEAVGFITGDNRALAKQAMEKAGIRNGTIPVLVSDPENNFSAMTIVVQDGEWESTTLEGWTDHEGKWTSWSKTQERGRSHYESEY